MRRLEIQVEIVKAFTDGGTGGNPAGVVREGAHALTPVQRQEVARDVGLSETAFVLPPSGRAQGADLRLEFYTPTRSIPHCGHATVAAFARLCATGAIGRRGEVVNETADGPRRIRIDPEGRPFLEQVPTLSRLLDAPTAAEVLASLGVTAAEVLPDAHPTLADNGNRTVLIGVREPATLARLQPDLARIEAVTKGLDAVCYYVFALGSEREGRDAAARMFGPAYGIPEEAATGMAAGPLACWLEGRDRREAYAIEQGRYMDPPSPSLLLARPDRAGDGAGLTAMWIGGEARAADTRTVVIETAD